MAHPQPATAAGERCSSAPVRLDDQPRDPLYGAAIQSQDGLGTCASNTLSLLLQAALPGHPAVSFLDLAFHDQDMKDRAIVKLGEIDSGAGAARKGDDVLAFWGDHVCNQFYIARNTTGGVCPREVVKLESAKGQEGSQAGKQASLTYDLTLNALLTSAGRIFDARGAAEGGAAAVFEEIGRIRGDSCNLPAPGTGILRDRLVKEAALRRQDGVKDVPSDAQIDETLARFYGELQDAVHGVAHVSDWFEAHPHFFQERLKADFGSVLPPVGPEWLLFQLKAEMDLVKRLDPIECAKTDWESVAEMLKESSRLPACTDPSIRDSSFDFARQVDELGWNLDETVLRVLTGTLESSPAEFFESVIAPGCAASRIRIPDDVACWADWLAPDQKLDRTGVAWKTQVAEIHTRFEERLSVGIPVALSICSAVLSDFTSDGANGVGGCPGKDTDEHSSHAIAAIGYRDVADGAGGCRREILLQNSWGVDWCAAQGERCENGKLWIPEEALARNIIRMDSIKPVGGALQ